MSEASFPPGAPRRARDALVVFGVALAARLAIVLWAHARFPPVEDGHFYDVLARRLASGAGYTWLWPDGAVTYAAHYPVGYPALLALAYVSFGASPAVAMTVNALLGAAASHGVHRLVDEDGVSRWRPIAAGLVAGLHPALLPYTVALMTEGVTASLIVIAAALAVHARQPGRSRLWLAGAAAVMGIATLVRPQSLALAPVLGALAAPAAASGRIRTARALALTLVALACVAPWTARNCVRMQRCALVSVNGGWNLLIGAVTTTGGWQQAPVPPECATVWDEAGKDACFERAAWKAIGREPGAWLARVPAKLASTFDYFGAAPWYLHASAPAAFDERAKVALGTAEVFCARLLLLGALVACGSMAGACATARRVVALAGAAGALTVHGWIGYLAIVACVGLAGRRAVAQAPMMVPLSAAVILVTACIHAAFFGAGRYGLVVVPFVAALAFSGRPADVITNLPWGRNSPKE